MENKMEPTAQQSHRDYVEFMAQEKNIELASIIKQYSRYSHPLMFMLADALTELKNLKLKIEELNSNKCNCTK